MCGLRIFVAQLWATFVVAFAANSRGAPVRVWLDYMHPAFQTEMHRWKQRLSLLPDHFYFQVRHEDGFNESESWDIYISNFMACQEALALQLRPLGRQVNCLPGIDPIVRKRQFFQTLSAAFGAQVAAAILPVTFHIPEDFFGLASHLQGQDAPHAMVLKAETHKAQGLQIVPAQQALAAALASAAPRRLMQRAADRSKPILAQRLIQDQLLLGGRLINLRVWVVVCGPDPIRAYLFRGGGATVGKKVSLQEGIPGNGSSAVGAGPPAVPGGGGPAVHVESPDDFVVNVWKEGNGVDVLALRELQRQVVHSVGQAAWDTMWLQLEARTAAAVAAAAPKMRREGRIFAAAAAGFPVAMEEADPDLSHVPHGLPGDLGGYQLLGLDVLLDSNLRPWIVEGNTPSLRFSPTGAPGTQPGTAGGVHPYDAERDALVDAALQLLLSRHRAGAQALARAAEAEEERQGGSGPGWVPAPEAVGGGNWSAQALREATVHMAVQEAAAAAANNFSVLNPFVYQALECMAAGARQAAGGRPPPSCLALQELLLQPPAQLPACVGSMAVSGVCGAHIEVRGGFPGRAGDIQQPGWLWERLSALTAGAQSLLAKAMSILPFPAFQWGAGGQQGLGFEFSPSDDLFRSTTDWSTCAV